MNFSDLSNLVKNVDFNIGMAIIMLTVEFIYWYVMVSWSKAVQGNIVGEVAFYIAAININDYISKYIAPQNFIYIIPSVFGGVTGGILAVLIDKRKKKKVKDGIKLVPKKISAVK